MSEDTEDDDTWLQNLKSKKSSSRDAEESDEENVEEADDEEESDKDVPEVDQRTQLIQELKSLSDQDVVDRIMEDGVGVLHKTGRQQKLSPYRQVFLQFIRKAATTHLQPLKGLLLNQPIEYGKLCEQFKVYIYISSFY